MKSKFIFLGSLLAGVLSAACTPPESSFRESQEQIPWKINPPADLSTQGTLIVFDAGSSGTRVYILEWTRKSPEDVPQIVVAPSVSVGGVKAGSGSFKIEPGVSTFHTHPEQISHYLAPLLGFLKEKLGGDPDALASIPVYFKATGGVRLLSMTDQKLLLDAVRMSLVSSGLRIPNNEAVSVISGEDEGIYAWLAVNLRKETLGKNHTPQDTIGIVEMGGASIQMAFVPRAPSSQEHMHKLRVRGKDYPVYSITYEGFGANSARENLMNSEACLPKDYPQAGQNKKSTASDYEQCKQAILAKWHPYTCMFDSCGLDRQYQPHLSGYFLALSAFAYYGADYLDESQFSPNTIRQKGHTICNYDYDTMKRLYPKVRSEDLPNGCFNLAYMDALFSGTRNPVPPANVDGADGLGFPPDTDQLSYPPQMKINDKEISWPIGFGLVTLEGLLASSGPL